MQIPEISMFALHTLTHTHSTDLPWSQAIRPIILDAYSGQGAVDFILVLIIKHFAA